MNKKCVAMLLAGGQGSRLYALTNKVAKPAVSFGGKYRIIDFPLSNCINSGIDTVGVLTQYQPLALNEYIGNGEPWDLDRVFGGVHILPPYQAKTGGDWYKGTANAIYQNLRFIDKFNPEHVLILSGDHIYKMDYNLMLRFHRQKNADCTIAVLDVTPEEASRFGIMAYDGDNRITSFEEKPKVPKSLHASMGIYIFKTEVLRDALIRDEADPKSSKDFGKNIIPGMLADGKGMFAYQFNGYWKDVGTVTSLWEANMDLIGDNPAFDLSESHFKIYSRNASLPPQYTSAGAVVQNSLLTAGCRIYGTVQDSVLGEGVVVGRGAVVKNSVVMKKTVIGEGAVIHYGVIDENVRIGKKAKIGDAGADKTRIALVGGGVVVPDGGTVKAGEMAE